MAKGYYVPAPKFLNDQLTPVSGNPDGYYETPLHWVSGGIGINYRNAVVKLWPTQFGFVDWDYVDDVVICTRSMPDQLRSIDTQIKREGLEGWTSRELLDLHVSAFHKWLHKLPPTIHLINIFKGDSLWEQL